MTVLALDPEQIAPSGDGGLDPITEATHSTALESNTGLTSIEVCAIGPSDSSPDTGSEPRVSAPVEFN